MANRLSIAERRYHNRMQANTAKSLLLQPGPVKDAFCTERRHVRSPSAIEYLDTNAASQKSCWSPDTMSSTMTSRRGSNVESVTSDTNSGTVPVLDHVEIPQEEQDWDTLASPTLTPETEKLDDMPGTTRDESTDDDLLASMETLLGVESTSRKPIADLAAERLNIAMPLTTQALTFHRQRMASDSVSVIKRSQNHHEANGASPTHRVVVKPGLHESILATAGERPKAASRHRGAGSEALASYFPPFDAEQGQRMRRRRAVTSSMEQNHKKIYEQLVGSSTDDVNYHMQPMSRSKRFRETSVEQEGTSAPCLIDAFDIVKPERKRLSFLRATKVPYPIRTPARAIRSPTRAVRSPLQSLFQAPIIKHTEHTETHFVGMPRDFAAPVPEQISTKTTPVATDKVAPASHHDAEQGCGKCACCRAKSPTLDPRDIASTPVPPVPAKSPARQAEGHSRARQDLDQIHRLMEQLFLKE